MTFLPILLLLALAAGSARANIEYVDMGPVSGTVQGHVWSKVVDEVGNTKGRAETWQVNLDGPADVVFTFRAPDLYQVNARISWWIDGEGEFTWDMGSTPKEQIPGGYQISFSFDPKFKKRIAVTVSPKRTVADQIYQLTVASARTGQTPATGAAGDSPETAVVGTWVYRRNDQIRETLVIARSGEGFTVTVLDADGAQISRTDGRFENGWLVTQDARNGGRARVSPDGSLEFVSTRLDTGAVIWTGPGREGANVALVSAGEIVLALTDTADLIVLSSTAGQFAPLARFKVADSPTWSHPVVTSRGLLVKDKTNLSLWAWPS